MYSWLNECVLYHNCSTDGCQPVHRLNSTASGSSFEREESLGEPLLVLYSLCVTFLDCHD